jgi:hypothetical protein
MTGQPRHVRCSRCQHTWQAELPKEIIDALQALSEPSSTQTALPETILSDPADTIPLISEKPPLSAHAKFIRKIAGGIFVALFVVALIVERQEIAQNRPQLEGIYDALGLTIYHLGGEGLSFEKVRSELRFDGGIMKLVVEGKIHNGTKFAQEIPNILATAIGSDGHIIQSWQIDAPSLRVFDGESIPFHSSIYAPRETVVDLNLGFIEIKHEHEPTHHP